MFLWAQPRVAEGWQWLLGLVLLPKSSLDILVLQDKLPELLWAIFCGTCEVPAPFLLALCGSATQPWLSHLQGATVQYNFLPFLNWKEKNQRISNPWYLKNQGNQDYYNEGLYLRRAHMFISHPHTLLTASSSMFSSVISSPEFLTTVSNVKKELIHTKQLTGYYLHKQ